MPNPHQRVESARRPTPPLDLTLALDELASEGGCHQAPSARATAT